MDPIKAKRERVGEITTRQKEIAGYLSERSLTKEEQDEWSGLKGELEKLGFELEILEEQEQRQLDQAANKNKFEPRKAPEPAAPEVKKEQEHLKSKEARNSLTTHLFMAVMNEDDDAIRTYQTKLAEGGHYADMEKRDGFSTFKDDKGGVFIPTSIADEVFEMTQEFGVIPQYSENFGINGERKKVASILGRPTFSAVNEKSAISGSGFTFGGLLLDLLKWGCIVDWSNESDSTRILPILQRKIAEGSAYLYDNTVFNADGTSTYHKLKGFINLAADSNANYVSKVSADTGDATFAGLDADDWNALRFGVSPSCRRRGIYVAHPDMEEHLTNLQDGQGQYIYGGPNSRSDIPTLWGRPLAFSEAFPFTDGADVAAAAFFDPSYLAYGTGDNMTAKMLDQATITDEDGNSVNLATMDAQALRFLQHFDFQLSDVTTTSGGSTRGAFAVLYTAAS